MENKNVVPVRVGCIICGVLSAFGFVATITSLLVAKDKIWDLPNYVNLFLLTLIVYYAFIGYKKPHGNLLKYIMLIAAALHVVTFPSYVEKGYTIDIVLVTFEVGILCYVAGRLAKVKENLILMIMITLFEIVYILSATIRGIIYIGACTPIVIWLDICVAYFLRYKEHTEAGLTE